jgi:hypothetical protein
MKKIIGFQFFTSKGGNLDEYIPSFVIIEPKTTGKVVEHFGYFTFIINPIYKGDVENAVVWGDENYDQIIYDLGRYLESLGNDN